jgi:hypothetical protein
MNQRKMIATLHRSSQGLSAGLPGRDLVLLSSENARGSSEEEVIIYAAAVEEELPLLCTYYH